MFLASFKTDGLFQVDFKSQFKKKKSHRQEGQPGKLLKVKCEVKGAGKQREPLLEPWSGGSVGMRGAKTGSWDRRRKPQLSLSFRCERQWAELGNQKGGTAPGPLVSRQRMDLLVALSWVILNNLRASFLGVVLKIVVT